MKGDTNGAYTLVDILENGWWEVENNVAPDVITYVSPDRKWKINLREKYSSGSEFYEYWYKVEVVIDLINENNNSKAKIKFIKLVQ